MKIAFVGTRGVPASYSGFETFVEQVGVRLVERGHEVTVYCRRHHFSEHAREYRGMRLVHVSGIRTKHLDTITHTAVSCVHAARGSFDVLVMCISGNAPLVPVARLSGARVVLNVDGSDWRRKKWNALARTYIRLSEALGVRLPDATVTDSTVMQEYYRERFGIDVPCIAYGSDLEPPHATGLLDRLGLEERGYFLFVGRLVPENCAHHLVDAYAAMDTHLKCVVVGDAPYAEGYIRDLKARAADVIFPGYVFGDGYRELMYNAHSFVLSHEVGGTHPVLVEAMSAGNCVIVNDTPTNLEVIDGAGLSYDGQEGARDLRRVLELVATDTRLVESLRARARERALQAYSWAVVTDQYEDLFSRLTGQDTGPRLSLSPS